MRTSIETWPATSFTGVAVLAGAVLAGAVPAVPAVPAAGAVPAAWAWTVVVVIFKVCFVYSVRKKTVT